MEGIATMDKNIKDKKSNYSTSEAIEKVKPFQELSDEIQSTPELENIQPTPHPKDFEVIEY